VPVPSIETLDRHGMPSGPHVGALLRIRAGTQVAQNAAFSAATSGAAATGCSGTSDDIMVKGSAGGPAL
jgi:hypothetical protein